jgi:hypothetical protein
MESYVGVPTFPELRQHVLEVLCQHDQLDSTQTPLKQAVIFRRNRACGLFFEAQGPRLLRTFAVWAGDEGRILFYDCNGLRFAESRLSESPDPTRLIDPPQAQRLAA